MQSTADAYPGDKSAGYYYTNNYGASPSGTIVIPLPAGMQPGWHQYAISEWDPSVNSQQFNVVDIGADGGPLYDDPPSEPWGGQFGTNQQWLKNPQNNQGGWVQLGPGPQSDSSGDGGASSPDGNGGYGVWITSDSGHPYLQIHYSGFENAPESFDALHLVQIDGPTWNSDLNGNSPLPWSDPSNWSTGAAPNAPGAVANFLHVSTAPGTVTVDEPVTVGLMNFSNPNAYTLASLSASNNITMNNSGSNSLIEVLQGNQEIDAPMVLGGNGVLGLSLDMTGTFTINGNISEAAAGTGVLKVDADSTGTLLLSGTNAYSSTEVLGGTLDRAAPLFAVGRVELDRRQRGVHRLCKHGARHRLGPRAGHVGAIGGRHRGVAASPPQAAGIVIAPRRDVAVAIGPGVQKRGIP